MSAVVWVMMGIAVWHFAVFVPDRFLGGIVGAFCAAVVGAFVFGLAVNGFDVPGRSETHFEQAVLAVPGALIGLTVCWVVGARRERAAERAVAR